jgi:hypothetical protein
MSFFFPLKKIFLSLEKILLSFVGFASLRPARGRKNRKKRDDPPNRTKRENFHYNIGAQQQQQQQQQGVSYYTM